MTEEQFKKLMDAIAATNLALMFVVLELGFIVMCVAFLTGAESVR